MPSLKGSKVLVTGGAGHIGSHVVDAVLSEGASQVVVYDNFAEGNLRNLESALETDQVDVVARDIRDYEDLEAAMKGCDFVFHTASIMLLEARVLPRKAIETNITGTFNVLQAAAKHGVQKVIFSSTGSVYGEPLYLPMDENHPYNNETIYGATKIAGEQFCRNFHREHNLGFVALRYFNVYGPREAHKGVPASMVYHLAQQMRAGQRPRIFKHGEQKRDFVYVKDVLEGSIRALDVQTSGIYNLGTGQARSFNELVDVLNKCLGTSFQPDYIDNPHAHYQNFTQADLTNARSALGYEPRFPLEDGVRDYMQWLYPDK